MNSVSRVAETQGTLSLITLITALWAVVIQVVIQLSGAVEAPYETEWLP